jgi:hypothetical protein
VRAPSTVADKTSPVAGAHVSTAVRDRNAMLIEPFETDAEETQEWLDSVDGLVETEGVDRAGHVLRRTLERARSPSTESSELGVNQNKMRYVHAVQGEPK